MMHIHKYERIKYKSGFTIFKCQLPDCPHWTRAELVENKSGLCWRCGNSFIIGKRHMRLRRLHCDNCTSKRDKSMQEFLKAVGGL